MKKLIGPYTFELVDTQIYVRETATGQLLKAVDYPASKAVSKFKTVCDHWESKMATTVA